MVTVLGDDKVYCTEPNVISAVAAACAAFGAGVTVTVVPFTFTLLIRAPGGNPPPLTPLLRSAATKVPVTDVSTPASV